MNDEHTKGATVPHTALVGFDAWLRDAHHPNPDWFPSDSREVNIAWGEFALNNNGVTAMHAIVAIMDAGLLPPAALVPWVTGASKTWLGEAAGNGREGGKIKNRESLADDFEAIYSLQMRGYTKAKATEMISETSTRTYQTLYDTRKYKAIVAQVKAGVHYSLLLAHLKLFKEGREEQAEQFVQEYHGFFDTELAAQTFEKYRQITVKHNKSQ